MMKTLGILVALFALVGMVSAFPFTADVNGPSAVGIIEDMTITPTLDIHNVDFEPHVVTITATTDSPFVTAKPLVKKFTLNGYESTQIGLDIHTSEDTDHDTYTVTVKVDADGQVTIFPITVYVGSNPFLTIGTFNKTVCGNDFSEGVSFTVKNNTSEDTTVAIHAEQPILFPTFADETLDLTHEEQKVISLDLATSPDNTGLYKGTFYASNDQILAARPFSIQVNDCPTPIEQTISLTLPKKPKDLVKLQTTFFPITLKNLTDETQHVDVSVDSAIPAGSLSVVLSPNESLTIDLPFMPDLSTKAGVYPVNITATDDGFSVTQTVNMTVLPLSQITAEGVTTIYSIAKGETKTMLVLVTNVGDVSQNISAGMQYAIPGIDFTFSPANTFALAPGKSQVVEVTVSVDASANIVSVNNAVIISGTPVQFIPVTFDVTADNTPLVGELKIVSSPSNLELVAGGSVSFDVVVENPTDESVLGLHFKMVGVKGSGLILIPADPTQSVAPHQTKTMSFKLMADASTKAGIYSPIIVMESPKAGVSLPIGVTVKQEGFLAGITGFLALLGGNASMIGLILIVLIIGIWLVGRISMNKPNWVSKWAK